MDKISRRELLGQAALAGGLLATSAGAFAQDRQAGSPARAATGASAYAGFHKPCALSFAPAELSGLSKKLITSHFDSHYALDVERLNVVQKRIGQLPHDAPPYLLGALKREELRAFNSMHLHELYFGALGGSGKPKGVIAELIEQAYGSHRSWELDFRATALSLAGGSGWVVLAYVPGAKQVLNLWSSDHLVGAAAGIPLLAMDMYDHAYRMDYGADARAYVAAFLANTDWDEIERRAKALA